MPLTPDDVAVLATLARYYVLTREQLQRIHFPAHNSGRATRRRLTRLRGDGLLTKHQVQVTLPHCRGAAPVYHVTRAGAELLASFHEDEAWLATNTRSPRGDRLAHWVAINDTRIVIEDAIARQSYVTLEGWFTEWETINKTETGEQRLVLHTVLQEAPPLSCSPDAAFMLGIGGYRKVFYLEQDRGTSTPKQIAARKSKGYTALAEIEGHRRHFPTTTMSAFNVLFVTTNEMRCRTTGRYIAKRPGSNLWLFVSQRELTAESFLFGEIVYDHLGGKGSLIPPPAT